MEGVEVLILPKNLHSRNAPIPHMKQHPAGAPLAVRGMVAILPKLPIFVNICACPFYLPFTTVTVDPRANKATVKRTKLNVWGVLSELHHLTGVQGDGLSARQPAGYADLEPVDGRHQRQPLGVGLRWAMDLVSTPGCARPGLIALALGTLCCGFFLFCL